MEFSKFQKKIIKKMLAYIPDERDFCFKDFLYDIFETFFKKEKVFISPTRLEIVTGDFFKTRRELIELFYLIKILREEKVLFFITTNKEYSKEFYFNTTTDEILENKDFLRINLDTDEIELICNNLYSDYYITSKLFELVENDFETLEKKSLLLTRRALYISIFFSFLSLGLNWCTSTSVTKIEFNKPEQLKEISTTTIYLK